MLLDLTQKPNYCIRNFATQTASFFKIINKQKNIITSSLTIYKYLFTIISVVQVVKILILFTKIKAKIQLLKEYVRGSASKLYARGEVVLFIICFLCNFPFTS